MARRILEVDEEQAIDGNGLEHFDAELQLWRSSEIAKPPDLFFQHYSYACRFRTPSGVKLNAVVAVDNDIFGIGKIFVPLSIDEKRLGKRNLPGFNRWVRENQTAIGELPKSSSFEELKALYNRLGLPMEVSTGDIDYSISYWDPDATRFFPGLTSTLELFRQFPTQGHYVSLDERKNDPVVRARSAMFLVDRLSEKFNVTVNHLAASEILRP